MRIDITGFSEKEFFCKCNNPLCDRKLHMFENSVLEARIRFMVAELHKLRILLHAITGAHEVIIIITSGARCEQHNTEVGGVPNSRHVHCAASDFYVVVNGERYTTERLQKIMKNYSFMFAIKHMEKTTHGDATHITWEVLQ